MKRSLFEDMQGEYDARTSAGGLLVVFLMSAAIWAVLIALVVVTL